MSAICTLSNWLRRGALAAVLSLGIVTIVGSGGGGGGGDANVAPVADAGLPQNVVTGTVVTLNGTASSDANRDDTLTFSWTLTSIPAGSAAVLADATSGKPNFTADLPGTYVATLVVNDGKVNSNAATVSVSCMPGYRLSGLNFSPYIDGQDPNAGSIVTADQIRQRLNAVALYTTWIRTFGSTGGLELIPGIAAAMGLDVSAGAWISGNLATNEVELANLIAIGQAKQASTLIVGSEVLLRGDISEDALIAYIARVKAAVPGVPVAYADTYSTLIAHPRVIAAIDKIFANYYPYWEGTALNSAMAAVHGQHMQVLAAAAGKPVIVSETGWPSAGNTVGNAVPSAENAAAYFIDFVSWARSTGTAYLYFEAFDENWKTAEGPQGAHWGIWTSGAALKPGMQAVFDGATVADNWTSMSVPGGPGTPALEFTDVPAYGSSSDLKGRAWHVAPAAYRVAVYILVGNGWWTKPTSASPLTGIDATGAWVADVTTGGDDIHATRIAAFLVAAGYNPPIMLGGTTLPAELTTNAVASLQVTR